jgi:hypothetical protein
MGQNVKGYQQNYSERILKIQKKKLNFLAWVCEVTIPIERPSLVGEVSTNVCGKRIPRGQRDWSQRPYFRLTRPEPLLFLPSSSSVVLRGWVDPVPDPLLLRKSSRIPISLIPRKLFDAGGRQTSKQMKESIFPTRSSERVKRLRPLTIKFHTSCDWLSK